MARLAVRRAQEALGVLVAANGPVDAAAAPAFDVADGMAEPSPLSEPALAARPDVRLVASRIAAAERVLHDSWREYLPSVTSFFASQLLTPSGLFSPSTAGLIDRMRSVSRPS